MKSLEYIKRLLTKKFTSLSTESNTLVLTADAEIQEPLPKTPKEAVVYFIKRLDVEMVDMILDDHRKYMDFPKHEFMAKLRAVVAKMKAKGDTELIPFAGHCTNTACPNNCFTGFNFYGNKSHRHFNLLFELDPDGQILDLLDCNSFEEDISPDFPREGSIPLDPDKISI